MKTLIVAFVIFAAAMVLLSVGVIFKKKTPLKGSCRTVMNNAEGGRPDQEKPCDDCTCGEKRDDSGEG